MLHKAGSCKRCCKMPAIANCVARNVSLGRQLQAVFRRACSYKHCCSGQTVLSNVAQDRRFPARFQMAGCCKRCFTGQTVVDNVERGNWKQCFGPTVSSNVDQGRHPCCREQAVASNVAHWYNKLQTIFCRADSCKQCFTVQAVVSTGCAVAKIVSQGKQLQAMLLRAGNIKQCRTGLQLLRIMLQNAASYKQCCTGPGNVSNDSQGWQLQAMLPLAGSEQCKAIFHRACSCKQCFKGRQLEANLHGAGNCKQFCHRAGCWKQSFTVRAVASNVAWGWDLQFMLYRARSCKQCFTVAKSNLCKQYFTGPTVASKRKMTIFALYLPISSETQI